MKNKCFEVELVNGEIIKISKKRIKYVVFDSSSGIKKVGCFATKTKCIDGNLIVNRDEVLEELKDWRMK